MNNIPDYLTQHGIVDPLTQPDDDDYDDDAYSQYRKEEIAALKNDDDFTWSF